MKVLIIGGTGLISSQITAQALDAGFEVTLLNRGLHQSEHAGHARLLRADRRDAQAFAEALKGEAPDVVVDMIAFNAADAAQTLNALDGKAEQIIFTSSVAAYEQPAAALPIRESAVRLRAAEDFAYGYQKAEMERYLAACKTRSSVTVIRPSLTYGVGGKNIGVLRQNANIVRRIRAGKPLLLFGDGLGPWTFTFAPDLARAYVLSFLNANTYGRAFHVTSDGVNVWRDLYTTLGELAGGEPVFRFMPTQVLYAADERLFGHIHFEKKYASIYSSEAFRQAVPEWKPELNLRRGMEQIFACWEEEGFPADPQKEHLEDQLCELAERFEGEVKLRFS